MAVNRIILLLVLAFTAGSLLPARGETLEERKQRIMRKYMSERATIAESDMVVPSDLPEEELKVKESEKFKQPEIGLAREDSPAMPVLPPRPIPVQQRETGNWLLEDVDVESDDPFASDSMESDSDGYWSEWGGSSSDRTRNESEGQRSGYNPYADRNSARRGFEGYGSRSTTSGETGTDTGLGSRNTDIFGREASETNPSDAFGLRNRRTYGSSPDEGLLTSPFQRGFDATGERSRDSRSRRQMQDYQPSRNPYETGEQQEFEQRGSLQGSRPEETFQRTNPYEQWKERNKGYDPMNSSDYLNETMRRDSR